MRINEEKKNMFRLNRLSLQIFNKRFSDLSDQQKDGIYVEYEIDENKSKDISTYLL